MAARDTTTPEQADSREAEIVKLHARGHTHVAIAAQLSVDEKTVRYYVKRAHAKAAKLIRDIAEEKARALLALDEVAREAWEAWERSKEPAVTETSESGMGAKGSIRRDVTKTEHQVGDAAFLSQVQQTLQQRRALLGIDAPTRSEVIGKSGPPIDWDRVSEGDQIAFLEGKLTLADVARRLQPRD